jgi:hypothetical protein
VSETILLQDFTQNYDIWTKSGNSLEVDSNEPASFEEFILKNWKVEIFKSNLIRSFLVAASNGDFKIKFFELSVHELK